MRKLIYAVSLTFALGGLAPLAHAGEGCEYGSHAVKKNDMETPPPASASTDTKKKG